MLLFVSAANAGGVHDRNFQSFNLPSTAHQARRFMFSGFPHSGYTHYIQPRCAILCSLLPLLWSSSSCAMAAADTTSRGRATRRSLWQRSTSVSSADSVIRRGRRISVSRRSNVYNGGQCCASASSRCSDCQKSASVPRIFSYQVTKHSAKRLCWSELRPNACMQRMCLLQ
jgi:hypothetical protein